MIGAADNFMATMAARIAEAKHARHRNAPPAQTPPRLAPPPRVEPEPDAYTLEQIAERLGVTKRTVRKWKLPTFKMGRVVRVRRADYEAFLAQHTGQGD